MARLLLKARSCIARKTVVALLCGMALVHGCSGFRPAKFADSPVVTSISDNAPIPVPATRQFSEIAYYNDTYLRRPIVGALDVERTPSALDVNATDEVPRSSWFSPVPVDEIRESYDADGGPWPPYIVEAGPTLSQRGGIRIRDARGYRYELHRDPKKLVATTTAVKAIASRIVRALGYRTPDVWIVELTKKNLIVGPKDKSLAGEVERFLASGPAPGASGAYRVSATRWPRGVDVGNTEAFGTRSDDANDRIAHEDRRTLRALRLVAAWLALDRLSPENTKDVYEGDPDEGHLMHYVVGLEYSLGATHLQGIKMRRFPAGHVRGNVFYNFITLGLSPPRDSRPIRSLGDLGHDADPGRLPATYEPSVRMGPDDAYWIAKRIADLPAGVIDWAVQGGQLESTTVARQVTGALLARRSAVVHWAFERVTPLEPESLGLMRAELVLQDKAIASGDAQESEIRYSVRFLDLSGSTLVEEAHLHPHGSLVTIPLLSALLAAHGYFVVEVTAIRHDTAAPRTFEAHLVPATDAWRVAGIVH